MQPYGRILVIEIYCHGIPLEKIRKLLHIALGKWEGARRRKRSPPSWDIRSPHWEASGGTKECVKCNWMGIVLETAKSFVGGVREVSDDVLSWCLFRVRDSWMPSTGPAGWACDQSAGLIIAGWQIRKQLGWTHTTSERGRRGRHCLPS